ncbi:MAG: membrane dipeptidase [bacterium]|nr:membrane dipeptidase [bacterium]
MNYFDLHCDTLLKCFETKTDLSNKDLAVNFDSTDCFKDYCQVFAVWVPDTQNDPYGFYKDVLSHAVNKVFNHNNIELLSQKGSLDDVLKSGKRAAILSLESATPICDKLDRVDQLFNDGVRIITLTWNAENLIAGGVDSTAGLSRFGKKVIARMNKYNIAVDLSHLNERSFFEVTEVADYILATHSNCYKLCQHKRNLKNAQLKTILDKKGIVGLNFYPAFLKGDVFDSLYQNIQYLLEMGFENSISLGGDFDGADMSQKLNKPARLIDFADYLVGKNMSSDLIRKIFFDNSYNYFNNFLTKRV